MLLASTCADSIPLLLGNRVVLSNWPHQWKWGVMRERTSLRPVIFRKFVWCNFPNFYYFFFFFTGVNMFWKQGWVNVMKKFITCNRWLIEKEVVKVKKKNTLLTFRSEIFNFGDQSDKVVQQCSDSIYGVLAWRSWFLRLNISIIWKGYSVHYIACICI